MVIAEAQPSRICSACKQAFEAETRVYKGEIRSLRTCKRCREKTSRGMRRFRTTVAGKRAKDRENAAFSAKECARRYNATVKGMARSALQTLKRKEARERARETSRSVGLGVVARTGEADPQEPQPGSIS